MKVNLIDDLFLKLQISKPNLIMQRLTIISAIILIAVFIFFKIITASKSSPVIFNAPISAPAKIDNMDSSFLRIKLLTDKYEVSLFQKSITTNQPDSIENFIATNANQINKDKVVVIGNEKMKEFQTIKLLLKNNGVTRFIVNAE